MSRRRLDRDPWDRRLIELLQRILGQRQAIVLWIGIVGLVASAIFNRADFASLFGGLIPVSIAIGKDK